MTASGRRRGGAVAGTLGGPAMGGADMARRLPSRMPGGGGNSATSTGPRGAALKAREGAPGRASAAAWLSLGNTCSRIRATPAAGNLDQAAGIARSAVVQPDGHGAAVFKVGQAGDGGKLDSGVGGGESGLVEHLTVRGQARGVVADDGGETGLVEGEGFFWVVPDGAGLIWVSQDVMRGGLHFRRRRAARRQNGEGNAENWQ
jgi:hypothetical protein